MSKELTNKKIEELVAKRIVELGYEGKLQMDPIPNVFKRRQHYTKKSDGTCVFTAFMWQMNSLSETDLLEDIDRRIKEAAEYFEL